VLSCFEEGVLHGGLGAVFAEVARLSTTPSHRLSPQRRHPVLYSQGNARLEYVQAQLTRTSTLARQSFESQQTLDQAENDAASARADVAEAQANYDAAVAGPTREERAIADAQGGSPPPPQ
jgi:multidrug resistance efflux pump